MKRMMWFVLMTAALYFGSRSIFPRSIGSCPAGRCTPLATTPLEKHDSIEIIQNSGLISEGWSITGKRRLEPLH